jgi:hypothetical protein
MRMATVEGTAGDSITIRRIVRDGQPWRVIVRSWPSGDGVEGRLCFEPEPHSGGAIREWPQRLSAGSREDLLDQVHGLPDERLLALLRSLE